MVVVGDVERTKGEGDEMEDEGKKKQRERELKHARSPHGPLRWGTGKDGDWTGQEQRPAGFALIPSVPAFCTVSVRVCHVAGLLST